VLIGQQTRMIKDRMLPQQRHMEVEHLHSHYSANGVSDKLPLLGCLAINHLLHGVVQTPSRILQTL